MIAVHHVCPGKRTISGRVLVVQVHRPLCEPHRLCTMGHDICGLEEKTLKIVRLSESTERRHEVPFELQSPLK